MPSNERSAEWCRGAVAVLGRMVDECSTVFDSDLPHITQGNLEDYLAEYAKLLAAAEAREAGEPSATEVIAAAEKALPLPELQLKHAELAVELFNAEARLEKAAEVIEACRVALEPICRNAEEAERLLNEGWVEKHQHIANKLQFGDVVNAKNASGLIAEWKAAQG